MPLGLSPSLFNRLLEYMSEDCHVFTYWGWELGFVNRNLRQKGISSSDIFLAGNTNTFLAESAEKQRTREYKYISRGGRGEAETREYKYISRGDPRNS